MDAEVYICYLLRNAAASRTYVGITNNMSRRIRQHNGEIKGGAKSTRGKGPWFVDSFVHGFRDKTEILHFEHRMHKMRHPKTKKKMYARGSILKRRHHAQLLIRHIPTFRNCVLSRDTSKILGVSVSLVSEKKGKKEEKKEDKVIDLTTDDDDNENVLIEMSDDNE